MQDVYLQPVSYPITILFSLNKIILFLPLWIDDKGSVEEIKYKLMTFGIPVEHLPITNDGTAILPPWHTKRWLARLYFENRNQSPTDHGTITANSPTTPPVDEKEEDRGPSRPTTTSASNNGDRPTATTANPSGTLRRYDVLFGRGKSYDTYVGNEYFRRLINDNRARYDASDRKDKAEVCRDIVRTIHEQNGRFLQPVPNGRADREGQLDLEFVEVDDETAKLKVANCFRSFRRSQKKKTQATHP
jgi:hypothetical protein